MNKELIRELEVLADKLAISNSTWTPTGSNWADVYMEKFAELIVRECISKCNTIEDRALQHREYKMQSAATLIKILIEEHFGVEE